MLETPRNLIRDALQDWFTSGATVYPWWVGPLREVRCQHWTALSLAIQAGEPTAYEFDGRELHVWRDQPKLGDRCQCGTCSWL